MKYIRLTAKQAFLKKEQKEKVEKAFSDAMNPRTDDEGRDLEWYRNMNMKPPSELIDGDNDLENMNFPVTEEFFDFLDKKTIVPTNNIDYIIESEKEGCTVFFKSGEVLKVNETETEIFNLLNEQ